jgi:putative ABC transport system permease protein
MQMMQRMRWIHSSALATVGTMTDALWRDLRHAARRLLARPTYALITMGTLTLVIGAATAVLAVVNATLVRPLPFPDGARIAQLFLMPPGESAWTSRNPLSLGVFLRFRQNLTLVDAVEGLWSRERALGGDPEPETVIAGAVSPGLFGLFGGPPALGRTFTEAEDQANAKVVVLSHPLWQRRFGGDPAILGQTVLIDREPHEVIGVMSAAFVTAFTPTELWTPLNATEASLPFASTFVQTFARLRPGVTVDQLQAELTTALQAVTAEIPTVLTGWSVLGAGLRDAQFRLHRPSILALVGGVVALLLLASANLANLTLAEATSRRAEMALRAALGGGHAAIVRLQLVETLLLALAGGAAGLAIGQWMLPVWLALDPSLARTFGEIGVDWRVQMASAAIAVTVALAAGVAPLLRERGGDLAGSVADGTRRTVGSRRDGRVRTLLVATECALAVVLLACSALLLSAFERTARTNPGFGPSSVLAAQMRLSATAYPTEAARAALIGRALEQIRAVPGVASAGATLNRFVPGFFFVTPVHIENRPTPDGQAHTVQFRRTSPGYFETMRIPLVRGRDFNAGDGLDQPWVAIVSRQFADRHWPGEDPIGRRLRRGTNPRWLTVVGVVGDVSDVGFSQPPAPTVYITFDQNNVAITPVSLVVRTRGEPLALARAVRDAVLSADPEQPIDSVTTLEQFLADSIGPQRFRATLLLALGGIGLALAALGIYGVTARAVEERTAELGVRLALGATPNALAGLVVRQTLRVVLAGLSVGVVLALVAGRAMLASLPGLEDVETWVAAPALVALTLVAFAAAAIPARRAVAVSPTGALRSA